MSGTSDMATISTSDLNDDLDQEVFGVCKEKMRPVKKALKALDKPDVSLSKSEKKSHYLQHLKTIGVRIDECLQEFSSDLTKSKEWRHHLWTFVSKFTEYDAKKLYKLYKHSFKTCDTRDSDSSHAVRRDRHNDRHFNKQPSVHSSLNPLKRESSSGFPPNKILKKEHKEREEYNLFDPKPNIPYTTNVNITHSQNYRNWPKHENNKSVPPMRGMSYDRNNRSEHFSKPVYSREETDRKHRHPNDRRFQSSSQSQHSSQYLIHSPSGPHASHPVVNRSHGQYEQHFFPHSSVSVPINNSNANQSSAYQSWPSFNSRQLYHRNVSEDYRRGFPHNPDEKPLNKPLNR